LSDLGTIDLEALETLIQEVSLSGGAETANTQIFIERLTTALKLPTPDFAGEQNEHNDYTFERRVDFKFPDGSTSIGRIDCYKRDCFVLEAKQSSKRKHDTRQLDMLGEDAKQKKLGTAKRGTGGWDKSMRAARKQAENYARALPVSHGYPPFLLVLDVGNVLEIYADFSGQGKNYAQFPDRNSYRLSMEDLKESEIQDRLRKIWQDPQSLNPALISAVVTRDIAERLAKIAKRLEGDYDSEVVAHFLMRCLFTMFAEDVGLIPIKSFENLLEELKDTPETFVPMLEALWKAMDKGDFSPALRTTLRHFNGGLFADCRALPLDGDGIHELWVAAKRDWSDVEPAIFGTLLEQALDPRERGKLGAHYTPRTYVERLVIPTIIEPMRGDWEDVLARVNELHDDGKDDEALEAVKTFHHELCTTRVLDPACGTGNFLYVSLELMKRLEGEVLDTLDDLGLADPKLAFEGETVTPRQFFGLDLNERAVAIADLVLFKWQLRTSGLESISDPVLEKLGNIRHQDAILAYDSKTLARDEDGNTVTRWNGYSYKTHPITGYDIPDPDAQVESYVYENSKPAKWPEAEFIVGNPPFISARDQRERLGDGYSESLAMAFPNTRRDIDLLLYFWIQSSTALSENCRRVGLIGTARISQKQNNIVFNQAVGEYPIAFAAADHRWPSGATDADVRVSMIVVSSQPISKSSWIKTPDFRQTKKSNVSDVNYFATTTTSIVRKIPHSLIMGVQINEFEDLLSNDLLGSAGLKPYSQGFKVPVEITPHWDAKSKSLLTNYANGAIIGQSQPLETIIDANHLSESELLEKHPSAAQWLLNHVKPGRLPQRNKRLSKFWWKYEANRADLRSAFKGIESYFCTLENSPRRYFVSLPLSVLPDQKLRVIATDDSAHLAILSSRPHENYSVWSGGRTGKANTPTYNSRCFSRFPFPACVTDESSPVLRNRLEGLGNRLNLHRKSVMDKHDFLTMTGMYNILERVRELDAGIGEPLSSSEKDIYDAALIGVLKEIHDDIDRATLEAYGWSDLAPALIGKVGATLPSPHKSPEQDVAEEELLSRLVALNIERREEERTGKVRWLRPDYQIPKLGHKVKAETKDMDIAPVLVDDAPAWPKDGLDQIKVVRELLARSEAPVLPDAVSVTFKGRNSPKRKTRVVEVLETLVATGLVRKTEDKQTYFISK